LKVNLDQRQVRALKALISISQLDEGISDSLKYEVSTVLELLNKESSTNAPGKAEFTAKHEPFILKLDGSQVGLNTSLTPEVISYIFSIGGESRGITTGS
jgi:hypothetical protein